MTVEPGRAMLVLVLAVWAVTVRESLAQNILFGEEECETVAGPARGEQCQFPFIFRGKDGPLELIITGWLQDYEIFSHSTSSMILLLSSVFGYLQYTR